MIVHERKLTKNGALTIPSDIRKFLGIEPGDLVKISIDNAGDVVLHFRPICRICETHNVISNGSLHICRSCLQNFDSPEKQNTQ